MSITPQQRDAIVKPVRDGLVELVTGNPGLFRNRPDFIAGGGSNDRFSGAVRGISQLNCRLWAAADKSNFATRVNQTNAALCGPFLDSLGETPPDGDLVTEFNGGQCSGERYRPSGTYVVSCASTGFPAGTVLTWSSSGEAIGPVTGIGLDSTGAGWLVQHAGPNEVRCTSDETGFTVGNIPRAGVACTQISTGGRRGTATVAPVITSTNPQGFVDDCGSPPPDLVPPGVSSPATPPTPNITVDIPGIGPTGVTLDFTDDGDLVVCIDPLNVCFTVPVGGDEPGAGGGGGGAVPGEGESGSPGETGEGGDADGEAGEDEELVGILIDVLTSPQGANTFDNNSSTVFRGIGYVRMGYPGRLGVDITGGTVISPQFFHAPQRGLTAWAVSANLGFNLRATPYYRTIDQ